MVLPAWRSVMAPADLRRQRAGLGLAARPARRGRSRSPARSTGSATGCPPAARAADDGGRSPRSGPTSAAVPPPRWWQAAQMLREDLLSARRVAAALDGRRVAVHDCRRAVRRCPRAARARWRESPASSFISRSRFCQKLSAHGCTVPSLQAPRRAAAGGRARRAAGRREPIGRQASARASAAALRERSPTPLIVESDSIALTCTASGSRGSTKTRAPPRARPRRRCASSVMASARRAASARAIERRAIGTRDRGRCGS